MQLFPKLHNFLNEDVLYPDPVAKVVTSIAVSTHPCFIYHPCPPLHVGGQITR